MERLSRQCDGVDYMTKRGCPQTIRYLKVRLSRFKTGRLYLVLPYYLSFSLPVYLERLIWSNSLVDYQVLFIFKSLFWPVFATDILYHPETGIDIPVKMFRK